MSSVLHRLGPLPADVAPLVDAARAARRRARPPEEGFAWVWRPLWEQPARWPSELALLRRAVAGQPVLDLGGGRPCLAAPLGAVLGASEWIVVDPAVDAGEGAVDGCPVRRLADDALAVLARLPDACACAVVGGLDHDVVADTAWHARLAVELGRVVPVGGVVLHTEATVGGLLPAAGFRPVVGSAWLDAIFEEERRWGGGWLGTGIAVRGAARG